MSMGRELYCWSGGGGLVLGQGLSFCNTHPFLMGLQVMELCQAFHVFPCCSLIFSVFP